MRRALLAALAGGTLLTGAACSHDPAPTDPVPTAAPAPSATLPPEPDYTADTEQICAGLQSVYKGDMAGVGTQIGKMISFKEAKQAPQAEAAEKAAATQLWSIASKILKGTAAAQDPSFKSAGATTAGKLQQSAKDRKYFDRLHTLDDLNKTIEPQIADWLSPFAGFCQPASPSSSPSTPSTSPSAPSKSSSAPSKSPSGSPSAARSTAQA